MIQSVLLTLDKAVFPFAISFQQFLKKNKNQYLRSGNRILFESIQLKTDNGQILHIYDGILREENELELIVANKMDSKIWFKITMTLDGSMKFIQRLEFTRWEMQVGIEI